MELSEKSCLLHWPRIVVCSNCPRDRDGNFRYVGCGTGRRWNADKTMIFVNCEDCGHEIEVPAYVSASSGEATHWGFGA